MKQKSQKQILILTICLAFCIQCTNGAGLIGDYAFTADLKDTSVSNQDFKESASGYTYTATSTALGVSSGAFLDIPKTEWLYVGTKDTYVSTGVLKGPYSDTLQVSCWYYPKSFNSETQIIGQRKSDFNNHPFQFRGWELGFSNAKLNFLVRTKGYNYVYVVEYDGLELNKWYHIGAEYNKNYIAIFVGGVEVGRTTERNSVQIAGDIEYHATDNAMTINGYVTQGKTGLSGLLGKLKLYDTVTVDLTVTTKECPENMGMFSNKYCEDCLQKICKACSVTNDKCTQCYGTYVVQGDGSCKCPAGQYETPEETCVSDCTAVAGKTYYHDQANMKCVANCFPKYQKLGICEATCPSGEYGNDQTSTCTACHASCIGCTGPYDTDCELCVADHFKKVNCYSDCSANASGQVDTHTGTCSKCGNGVVDEDELCDDGNSNSGNGCSNLCVPETGWSCLNPGGPCQHNSLSSDDLLAYYPLIKNLNDYSSKAQNLQASNAAVGWEYKKYQEGGKADNGNFVYLQTNTFLYAGATKEGQIISKYTAVPKGTFAVQCVVNPQSLSGQTAIFGVRNVGAGYSSSAYFRGFELGFNEKRLQFSVRANTMPSVYTQVKYLTADVKLNYWYNVAGTYDADKQEVKLYIGGQQVGVQAVLGGVSGNGDINYDQSSNTLDTYFRLNGQDNMLSAYLGQCKLWQSLTGLNMLDQTSQCPQGTGITGNVYCEQCASINCQNCQTTTSNCVECFPGYYLTPTGTCVADCKDVSALHYKYGITKTCVTDCLELYKNDNDNTCYAICPTPYFADSSSGTKKCTACHANCPACTGPNEADCSHLFCGVSQAKQQFQCVAACTGNYKQNTVKQCTLCGNGIQDIDEECDDANWVDGDGCNKYCKLETGYTCPGGVCVCRAGYKLVLTSKECVLTCPLNTLDTGTGTCTSCGNGILDAGEMCDDGNWVDGDGCSKGCILEIGYECLTPNTACTCKYGYKTIENSTPTDCQLSCPATYVVKLVTTCSKCGNSIVDSAGPFLETCDDGNNIAGDGCSADCKVETGYQCVTPGQACICAGNYYQIEGTSRCEASCPALPTKYVVKTGEQICQLCGNGAKDGAEECDDGNQTNGDGCTSLCKIEPGYTCNAGVCQCSNNFYNSGGACLVCHASCFGCTGATGFDCTNCANNYKQVFPEGIVYTGIYKCLTECPAGYSDTGTKCTLCGNAARNSNEECDDSNIQNGDGCTEECKIQIGYLCPGFNDANFGQACWCDTQYYDSGGNICLPCNVACDRCIGPADTQCIACAANYPYRVQYTNQCVASPCAAGYEQDDVNKKCNLLCGNSRQDAGEACDDGNINNYDGCSNKCVVESGWVCPTIGEKCQCMEGFYNSDGVCARCNEACKTCYGPLSTNCLSCAPTYFSVEGTNLHCVDQCPAGTILNGAACQFCGNKVINTIKGVREECDDGNFVSNDGCSSSCKQEVGWICTVPGVPCGCGHGYWYNVDKCVKCDDACDGCTAGTNKDCDKCAETFGYFKHVPSGKCLVQVCGNNENFGNFNLDHMNRSPCDAGPADTISCKKCLVQPGYYCWGKDLGGQIDGSECGLCITKNCDMCPLNVCTRCLDGYYLDANKQCQPCDYSCKFRCSGPGPSKCYDCRVDGYYMDQKITTCKKCVDWQQGCRKCQLGICTVCNNGFYHFILNNECYKECPGSYWKSKDKNDDPICADCPEGCKECTDMSTCQSCKTGYYKEGTMCYPCDKSCSMCTGPEKNQCSKCNDKYFLEGTTCEACVLPCVLCSSKTACISCIAPLFSYNSKCVDKCPANTFTYAESQCFDCTYDNCDHCKGYFRNIDELGVKTCVGECGVGQFKNLATNSCSKTCPVFYYGVKVIQTCMPTCSLKPQSCFGECVGNCKTCFYNNTESCLTCNSMSVYLENSKTCTPVLPFLDFNENLNFDKSEVAQVLLLSSTEDGKEDGVGAIKPTDQQTEVVFKAAHIDDDGNIGYQEMTDYMNLQSEIKQLDLCPKGCDQLNLEFLIPTQRVFDKNGDGWTTIEELTNALTKRLYTGSQIRDIIAKTDIDRNGVIDKPMSELPTQINLQDYDLDRNGDITSQEVYQVLEGYATSVKSKRRALKEEDRVLTISKYSLASKMTHLNYIADVNKDGVMDSNYLIDSQIAACYFDINDNDRVTLEEINMFIVSKGKNTPAAPDLEILKLYMDRDGDGFCSDDEIRKAIDLFDIDKKGQLYLLEMVELIDEAKNSKFVNHLPYKIYRVIPPDWTAYWIRVSTYILICILVLIVVAVLSYKSWRFYLKNKKKIEYMTPVKEKGGLLDKTANLETQKDLKLTKISVKRPKTPAKKKPAPLTPWEKKKTEPIKLPKGKSRKSQQLDDTSTKVILKEIQVRARKDPGIIAVALPKNEVIEVFEYTKPSKPFKETKLGPKIIKKEPSKPKDKTERDLIQKVNGDYEQTQINMNLRVNNRNSRKLDAQYQRSQRKQLMKKEQYNFEKGLLTPLDVQIIKDMTKKGGEMIGQEKKNFKIFQKKIQRQATLQDTNDDEQRDRLKLASKSSMGFKQDKNKNKLDDKNNTKLQIQNNLNRVSMGLADQNNLQSQDEEDIEQINIVNFNGQKNQNFQRPQQSKIEKNGLNRRQSQLKMNNQIQQNMQNDNNEKDIQIIKLGKNDKNYGDGLISPSTPDILQRETNMNEFQQSLNKELEKELKQQKKTNKINLQKRKLSNLDNEYDAIVGSRSRKRLSSMKEINRSDKSKSLNTEFKAQPYTSVQHNGNLLLKDKFGKSLIIKDKIIDRDNRRIIQSVPRNPRQPSSEKQSNGNLSPIPMRQQDANNFFTPTRPTPSFNQQQEKEIQKYKTGMFSVDDDKESPLQRGTDWVYRKNENQTIEVIEEEQVKYTEDKNGWKNHQQNIGYLKDGQRQNSKKYTTSNNKSRKKSPLTEKEQLLKKAKFIKKKQKIEQKMKNLSNTLGQLMVASQKVGMTKLSIASTHGKMLSIDKPLFSKM